jgi:hypothetical protein
MNQRLRVLTLTGSVLGVISLSLSCGTASDKGASSGESAGSGVGGTGAGSGGSVVGGTGVTGTGTNGGGTGASTGAVGGGSGAPSTGSGTGSPIGGTGSATGSSAGGSGSTTTTGPDTTGVNSILQRGPDLMRRETFLQPTLTKAAAAAVTMDTTFSMAAKFNGGMAASVLYVENGPPMAGCPTTATGCAAMTRAAGAGIFIAATNGGTVYALDETSGAIVWTGKAPGGGDGIKGTPVIDGATRTLFVTNGGGGQHLVHGLSIDDGTERAGWPVKLTNALTINGTAFNSTDENEHGAMMFLNGIVYVPFGGHYGDGGNYHGWVVAIQESNPTNVGGWVSAGGSEGIWAHGGGMASDGTNIYAVTSNGHAADHTQPTTDAEEVVKFTGMGTFTRNAANVYYPSLWQMMDGSDKDFGADSPSYVPLPAGSTPSALIVAPAKPGAVYFLDANNLSSGKYPQAGGELAKLVVGNTGSESVYTAPSIYQSASGLHAAIDVEQNPVCPAGGPTSASQTIVSMLIQPGAAFSAKIAWCALASGNQGKQYNQPPISTTTDENGGNALVWYTNGGVLTAVDGDTGASVVAAPGTCMGMEKMMWPIVVKGRIVVAADGHLCAWK